MNGYVKTQQVEWVAQLRQALKLGPCTLITSNSSYIKFKYFLIEAFDEDIHHLHYMHQLGVATHDSS